MDHLLYGVAYYDEYMPEERLHKDVAMMKKAGINTVRIAESTWSTCEPQEGVFDFSHVERVLDAMNAEFGLDYWSNRVNEWEDFPDVRGTINGSLGAEFEKFQRSLVDEFLSWQAGIVREYKREDQFITQNFDLEWRGHSFGVQPNVNHFHAAKCLTIAGIDIYHPSQEDLTGREIAFGGDLARSLKGDNYLLIETEAQGFPDWLPYKGQLRLQAYSHIASGANSVMYWHWHSLHNAVETYWKGLLSHDFEENAVYREACGIGKEFAEIGDHLVNLKKTNPVAIMVSNEALTALKWFPIHERAGLGQFGYNDVVRWVYDTLYHMNVECDFIWPESQNLERYDVIIVPALYAAPDALLQRLNDYVEAGGNLIMTFKSAFTNENIKVSHEVQPHIVSKCLGVRYHQFTYPKNTALSGSAFYVGEGENQAKGFMELLIPEGAEVLARYDHTNWKDYAAVTQNQFGKGSAVYIGCMTSETMLREILTYVFRKAGLEHLLTDIAWPVVVRKGRNQAGNIVRFYFNYSPDEQDVEYVWETGQELLSKNTVEKGQVIQLPPWGFMIIEAGAQE